MNDKCDEARFRLCENNTRCHLCDGTRLFKRPKWMDIRDKQLKRKAEGVKKKPKEGMKFEKKVTKTYNEQAKRSINSGATWFCPGDIITPNELIECKERGSTTSRGEKTFTVQKQQLDKIQEEALSDGKRSWQLVFGFKNDNKIYLIKDYEDELATVQYIKELEEKLNGNTKSI